MSTNVKPIVLLTLVLFFPLSISNAEEGGSFLPQTYGTEIKSSSRVKIVKLDFMGNPTSISVDKDGRLYRSPVPEFFDVDKGDELYSHPVSEKLFTKLKNILLSSNTIEFQSRSSTCSYRPGFKLLFEKDTISKENVDPSNPTTVLICFNCDVWAILDGGKMHYGDFRENSSDLKSLVNEIYGTNFFEE